MILALKIDTGQWNRIGIPKISPHIHFQIIYYQEDNNVCIGEMTVSSINGAGKIVQPNAKENRLLSYTTHKD